KSSTAKLDWSCLATESELVDNAFFLGRDDSASHPIYSFEIKPKWGSLPKHPLHSAEKTACRFCIQQYQKLQSGKFSVLSQYCPLKLFGIPAEQVDALCSMLRVPQNNLVFSINGNRESVATVQHCDFHVAEDDLRETVNSEWGAAVWEGLAREKFSLAEETVVVLLLTILNKCTILEDLLRLQNLSDLNDKEALDLYNNMKNEPSEAIYSQLCDYVMSRGARDCSIIVSLREIGSRGEDKELEGIPFLSLSIGSTPFVARICVIDFEVKKMEKIPLWYEQQLELLQSYDERSVG
ncbi:hypothetical protein WA577_002768, partial [Blastocystis sp. JDR]